MTLPVLESSTSSLALSDSGKQDPTFYENVLMAYFRNESFEQLNQAVYKDESNVTFENILPIVKQKVTKVGETYTYLNDSKVSEKPVLVWEQKRETGVVGIVTNVFEMNEFNKWKINLMLASCKIDYPLKNIPNHKIYTNFIVEQFAAVLKNTTSKDKWNVGGKDHFEKKVDFFTSRGLKVEAILPAFPCKSSNTNKVSGWKPDMGEEMALKTLCEFAKSIKAVYTPGMVIYIVSDGHVFSDCIGVDDAVVNHYGEELKKVYQSLNTEGEQLIRFCSLVDLFSLKKFPIDQNMLDGIELPHHIETMIDEEAEICRKILMRSCDTDCGGLRRDIETAGHPRLALFRGFARFMEEDLEQHPSIAAVSRKKQKKIISKVAFEMIKRNDAYSNLVELMFPMHLRFSIHAHNNLGPKYGIKLLSNERCRLVKSLDECAAPNYDDLLHIPTPWHNAVVKVANDAMLYVTKAEAILKSIEQGAFRGGFNSETNCFEVAPARHQSAL